MKAEIEGLRKKAKENRRDAETEQKRIKNLQKTKQTLATEIVEQEKKLAEKQATLASLTEAISMHIKEAESAKFEETVLPALVPRR